MNNMGKSTAKERRETKEKQRERKRRMAPLLQITRDAEFSVLWWWGGHHHHLSFACTPVATAIEAS